MTIFPRRLAGMGMDDHLISIYSWVECGEPYLPVPVTVSFLADTGTPCQTKMLLILTYNKVHPFKDCDLIGHTVLKEMKGILTMPALIRKLIELVILSIGDLSDRERVLVKLDRHVRRAGN